MNEVDSILTKEVEEGKTPSVQYVYFDRDHILHHFACGFADVKNKKSVDEHTTYNIYSVTKTFTALAVLQLAEQNKLRIDHPVKQYLPDFPYSSGITIRQLLAHSAGIPNPIPLGWIHLAGEHAYFNRNTFFNQVFVRHKKLKSKPNEKFAYSNLGYVLLGRVIERVAGTTYEQYLQRNIIEKLEVPKGALSFEVEDPRMHAKGYHKKVSFSNLLLSLLLDRKKYMDKSEGPWKPFKTFYVNGAAYGGLVAASGALVRYLQALLRTDSVLLKDPYRQQLFEENVLSNGKPSGMCLSWFRGQLGDRTYFTHAGGGGGYYCELRIYPEPGQGSVVLFNRTGMRDERFLSKVDQYLVH